MIERTWDSVPEPLAGPGTTTALYVVGAVSTVPGPVVRPIRASHTPSNETDPKVVWLKSAEARRFEGHWVALDSDTGEFLGLADTREDLRRLRNRDVTMLLVKPKEQLSR
jgi:hypothetical protein